MTTDGYEERKTAQAIYPEDKKYQQVQIDYDDYLKIVAWKIKEGRSIKGMVHVMVLEREKQKAEPQ